MQMFAPRTDSCLGLFGSVFSSNWMTLVLVSCILQTDTLFFFAGGLSGQEREPKQKVLARQMSEIKCQIHIDLTSSEPGLTLPDPNELLPLLSAIWMQWKK